MNATRLCFAVVILSLCNSLTFSEPVYIGITSGVANVENRTIGKTQSIHRSSIRFGYALNPWASVEASYFDFEETGFVLPPPPPGNIPIRAPDTLEFIKVDGYSLAFRLSYEITPELLFITRQSIGSYWIDRAVLPDPRFSTESRETIYSPSIGIHYEPAAVPGLILDVEWVFEKVPHRWNDYEINSIRIGLHWDL